MAFGLFTEKLLSGTREALCIAGSPVHSQSLTPGGSSTGMGPRRGSISSLSSVTSMLEEKDDEKIRCCHHCMDKLLKRQQKLEEKDHVPDIVKLYEVKRVGIPQKGSHILPVIHSHLSFGVSCFFIQNLSSCQRLRMCMEKVDEKAPEYIRMAESLK